MENERFASRIASMPTSIFSVMSKMAVDYNAVNLGQGFPDFDGPLWIMEEAFKAMKSGKNQYAPSIGIFSLRRTLAETYKKIYGLNWDPDREITVTAGATEALYSTITAIVNPGDEVIMFEPFYDAHQADVLLAGGTPVYVTLKKPDNYHDGFHFDFLELEKKVTPKTKLLILNNPDNPTGKVFSIDELMFIARLAIKYDFLVLSDEVYEFLTFDDIKHIPIATIQGMQERTITVSSTGKTFGMTGWKIGYAFARPEITAAINKIHQWTTFAVNTPGQHAMAYAFTQLDDYLPDFRKTYEAKRDFMLSELKKTPFKPHVPKGSYFLMADIPSGRFTDDIDTATQLVKNYGVATIPPSVFYGVADEGKTMLRFCFAKTDATLKAGMDRLKALQSEE